MKVVLFSRVPRFYSFKGDRLTQNLVREGHTVLAIIAEKVPVTKAVGEWKQKFGTKIFLDKVGKKLRNIASRSTNNSSNIADISTPPVFYVDSHNSENCEELLKKLSPDLLILRGCGIIRENILSVPRLGVINPHYALLPDFRGMDVTEWSVLAGAPIAVSIHSVDTGIDTGMVLETEPIDMEIGDTTGSLREKSAKKAAELICTAIQNMNKSSQNQLSRMDRSGHQYFSMHPRLRELANRRIQQIFK